MGTTWTYRCGSCEHAFKLSSTWGSMLPELIVVSLLAALIAEMFIPDFTTWWTLVAVGLVGVVASWSAYRARRVWHRYPLVMPTMVARPSRTRR